MILTTSNLKLFRNCRKKYKYRMHDELVPLKNSKASMIGNAVHLALEAMYRDFSISFIGSILSLQRTIKDYLNAQEGYEEEDIILMQGICEAMVEAYLSEKLSNDISDFSQYTPEVVFKAPIKSPKGRRIRKWQFQGVLDGLAQTKDGNWWVVEHKTTGERDLNKYKERLLMDYQSTGYIYGIRESSDIKPVGVIYNILRKPFLQQRKAESAADYIGRIKDDYKHRPNFYIDRWNVYRNEYELSEFTRELYEVYKDIRGCKAFYRNTSQCSGRYDCSYRSICRGFLDEGAIRTMFKRERPNAELYRHTESDGRAIETSKA